MDWFGGAFQRADIDLVMIEATIIRDNCTIAIDSILSAMKNELIRLALLKRDIITFGRATPLDKMLYQPSHIS